jgi:tetratricopeptide (TPR) repeat protein
MAKIVNPDLHKYGWRRLIVSVKIYGFYIRKMLTPGLTLMLYPELSEWGTTERGQRDAYKLNAMFWTGSVFALISLVVGVFLVGNKYFYLYLFMQLSLVQWCGISTATQTLADRYVSMPLAFMMLFLAMSLQTLFGVFFLPVSAVLLCYYAVNLSYAKRMFTNINNFYDYHNFYNPANHDCMNYKAEWFIKAGDYSGALELLRVCLAHNPKDFKTLLNMSACCLGMRDLPACEQYLNLAEANTYLHQKEIAAPTIASLRHALHAIGKTVKPLTPNRAARRSKS